MKNKTKVVQRKSKITFTHISGKKVSFPTLTTVEVPVRKTDRNKPREVVFEEAIHRMNATYRKKHQETINDFDKYNDEMREILLQMKEVNKKIQEKKKPSFIKRLVEIITYLKP